MGKKEYIEKEETQELGSLAKTFHDALEFPQGSSQWIESRGTFPPISARRGI